ncbi:Fc.00g112200.m01.CDS01 [Cosmosporella sp. VM-42]
MLDIAQQVDDLIANSHHISKWVEEQPSEDQFSYAQTIFAKLLENASQPRSSSGNACVKLCGFAEQASKSSSVKLRSWAISRDVTLKLLNFYIEWNESDNHRSMKLVLDLVPQLIRRNPDEEATQSIKATILDSLMSIMTGRSSKPLAKSAIKSLEHFLTKSVFALDEIRTSYVTFQRNEAFIDELEAWRSLIAELFTWMKTHFVCATAGKLITTLYRSLRRQSSEKPEGFGVKVWNQWLLDALAEEPSLLESIKTYIFLPLFKVDRGEALRFLKDMHEYEGVYASANIDVAFPVLLQLAAFETGKKVGLVEEPALSGVEQLDNEASSIILPSKVLESVLAHPSLEVRSLALSLLISSPSTTRPYSSTALDLLRKHLGTYFAESDAKFRNDVASKVRDMFKRVRGAIFILKRSIPRAAAKTNKSNSKAEASFKGASKPILYQTNLISLPEGELIHCLKYHESFLSWYIGFLCGELTPTASYQRHIASLKATAFVLRMEGEKSKSWETSDDQQLFFDSFDGRWVRALSDLIMDPFDDVREHAATVLKRIFSDERYKRFCLMNSSQVNASGEISELLKRADQQARRTARADQSDGVARACQLLYRFSGDEQRRLELLSTLVSELERRISVAEEDLGRAVLEAPLHGQFASLCYTWQVVSELTFSRSELDAVQSLQNRLVTCCERTWAAVCDILCDDSPEGHLPQDLEEFDGIDTKDVLSYSFRAVHEASNFMRTLVQPVRQRGCEGKIHPPREVFEIVGNLSFHQLASIRHRGAFSTVAATFATCCQLVKHLDQGDASDQETLLEIWYKGTLDAIFSQVSTTRRSAGIPAMMTGVLSANASKPSFDQVMRRLMEISNIEARSVETDGSNLPQVHAYNCLKDIFKSSYLASIGNPSEKYLPECLELAANGLKSELWAIRNCGLILLRSLIDCLFGSHESKSTMEAGWDGRANRISYHRYPSLPNTLLNLLKSGHDVMVPTASIGSAAAESVFPALDIIRRAGPPELLRDELQGHIAKYLGSSVWHVREIAARTLCSCLLHEMWLDDISRLATEAISKPGSTVLNSVHGALLAMRYLIERLREVMLDRLLGDLPKLEQFLREYWKSIKSLASPDIAAAYTEILNLVRTLPRPESDGLPVFEIPTSEHETALLRIQIVIHRVYSASESNDPTRELRSLLFENHLGVNSLIPALETIPQLWDVSKTSEALLVDFCEFYMEVCFRVGPAEPRVIALRNLTEILDYLLQTQKLSQLPLSGFFQLWSSLPSSLMNPALANAILRVSGCVLAIIGQNQGTSAADLQNWGDMMAGAGLDDKDFDTRLAAAESLRSFFTVTEATRTSEEYLPSLLALYDCLSDDDDDIRDIGSAAVKSILGQALVPLKAAVRLQQWLAQHFKHSPRFRQIVGARVTGDMNFATSRGVEVREQIKEAMKFDDSLFAIEEQNLFIDEARETQRWVAVFESLDWDPKDEVLVNLTEWTHKGLHSMHELMATEDGPLGYASQPDVFAILSRIIQASALLIRHHPDAEQRKGIDKSSGILRIAKKHMSDLLLQPLQETPGTA